MKQKSHPYHWLRPGLVRVAKIHLVIVAVYIAQIMVYDASKLITPDAVLKRWLAAAAVALVAIFVWYMARGSAASLASYKILTWILILTDISFAAFNVYTQRGMASRAVLLFIIPILVVTILHSRIALLTTAMLAVAVYTTTSVAYFVNNFNEGYKVELYGEILFYSALFIISAALLWSALKSKRQV
jgi:hypothetical protein